MRVYCTNQGSICGDLTSQRLMEWSQSRVTACGHLKFQRWGLFKVTLRCAALFAPRVYCANLRSELGA